MHLLFGLAGCSRIEIWQTVVLQRHHERRMPEKGYLGHLGGLGGLGKTEHPAQASFGERIFLFRRRQLSSTASLGCVFVAGLCWKIGRKGAIFRLQPP